MTQRWSKLRPSINLVSRCVFIPVEPCAVREGVRVWGCGRIVYRALTTAAT